MMEAKIAPPAATGVALAERRPLTVTQRRIWSLAQIGTEAELGHQLLALRLRGPLRPATLIEALALIERRHAILRTRFSSHAGSRITQHVEDAAMLALETIDLAGFTADQIAGETEDRLNEERRRGFDLEVEPPSRVLLLRFADDEHVLALSLHALVGDPPTLRILAADLLAVYSALASHDAPALVARREPIDPVVERSADPGSALDYWRTCLSDDAVANFPAAKGDGGSPPLTPMEHRIRLGAARSVGLHELGRQLGVPIPTLLLTALHLLLARYDRSSASRVGIVDDSHRPPGLAGRMQDIVPSQLRADGATRFAAAVQQVTQGMAAAASQRIPFELLAQHYAGELTPVLFEWRTALALRADGLRIELVADATPCSDAGIVVLATEQAQAQIDLALVYSPERFARPTLERGALHLLRILDAAISDPEIPLRAIALVDAAELDGLSRPYEGACRSTTGWCISSSRRRHSGGRTRRPSSSATGAGHMASSSAAPTGWRIGCCASAWSRSSGSPWPCRAHPRRSSPSWPC